MGYVFTTTTAVDGEVQTHRCVTADEAAMFIRDVLHLDSGQVEAIAVQGRGAFDPFPDDSASTVIGEWTLDGPIVHRSKVVRALRALEG